jgi:hypothetical protein
MHYRFQAHEFLFYSHSVALISGQISPTIENRTNRDLKPTIRCRKKDIFPVCTFFQYLLYWRESYSLFVLFSQDPVNYDIPTKVVNTKKPETGDGNRTKGDRKVSIWRRKKDAFLVCSSFLRYLGIGDNGLFVSYFQDPTLQHTQTANIGRHCRPGIFPWPQTI